MVEPEIGQNMQLQVLAIIEHGRDLESVTLAAGDPQVGRLGDRDRGGIGRVDATDDLSAGPGVGTSASRLVAN